MSALIIQGIVTNVQKAQVRSFEEKQTQEAMERKALRGDSGMNTSELLEQVYKTDDSKDVMDMRPKKAKKKDEARKVGPGNIPPPLLTDGEK